MVNKKGEEMFETLGLCEGCKRKIDEYFAEQNGARGRTRLIIIRRGQASVEVDLRATFPARARNVLKSWSLYQILGTSNRDFRYLTKGIGATTYRQLLEALAEYGLTVGMSREEIENLHIDVPE
jgi:DNA-directed RNA polymerase alpha subunit